MKYCLQSGLTKTKIYNAVRQFDTSGIPFPSLRKCSFRSYRNSYWFTWYDQGTEWEVYVSQFHGECTFSARYSPDYECYESNTRNFFSSGKIPFDYLFDNGFLREVA